MSKLNALHHIAISTGDMKKQIAFFSDVLGMELMALYWMHGAENAWHGFMKLGEESFAFVYVPKNEEIESTTGVTHAGNGAGASAPGTMQHIAFNVETQSDLLNMRGRIRSRGVNVLGPVLHGLCQSIYFAGPEGLVLEVSTSDGAPAPLDTKGTWIDMEVAELAGISSEELKQYMNPAPYEGENGDVPQPSYDETKPHMAYPKEVYDLILATPDEAIMAQSKEFTDPPADNFRSR